jgi:hypothetical protein
MFVNAKMYPHPAQQQRKKERKKKRKKTLHKKRLVERLKV